MEFRLCYENQTSQFEKKKIELGIPIILPSEVLSELKTLGVDVSGDEKKETGKKKDKKQTGSEKEKIAPSSILMIAIAVAMAAISGGN